MHSDDTPSLVIFDCDGVLIDSEVLACEVEARALARLGHPMTGREIGRRFLGMSARDMRRLLERELKVTFPDDHDAWRAAELAETFRRELKAVAGIADVLGAVDRTGWRRCVASSSSPDRIALSLGIVGLRDGFGPHVFSSTMVARGKPAPDLFLFAAASMGVAPSLCIVVEDSLPGIQAARAAGMRPIGFTGGSHCDADHGSRLLEAGAERVCADATELAGHLVALSPSLPAP